MMMNYKTWELWGATHNQVLKVHAGKEGRLLPTEHFVVMYHNHF